MDLTPTLTAEITTYVQMQSTLLARSDTTSASYLAAQTALNLFYATNCRTDANLMFKLVMDLTGVGFCVLFFAHQHISAIIYTSVTRRQFNPYALKNLWDFLIWCFFFIYIWITYKVNLNGTWKEKRALGSDYRAQVYAVNFTQGAPDREMWLLILCTISMWVRVFYMLRYNEYLGKLTGVLEKLLYDIFVFFCFFLVEVLFFSAVAQLAFRKVDQYNTIL
jgi:hypothetical protein